jgi:uncharacterized protein (DUF1330 family)
VLQCDRVARRAGLKPSPRMREGRAEALRRRRRELTAVAQPFRAASVESAERRAADTERSIVPAYVMANVDVNDPVRYEDYKRMVPPTIAKYGGRFIVRGGRCEVLEGEWRPNRLVLLEFPSIEQARAWWHSPEYADARALRQATSSGTLLILEGV